MWSTEQIGGVAENVTFVCHTSAGEEQHEVIDQCLRIAFRRQGCPVNEMVVVAPWGELSSALTGFRFPADVI